MLTNYLSPTNNAPIGKPRPGSSRSISSADAVQLDIAEGKACVLTRPNHSKRAKSSLRRCCLAKPSKWVLWVLGLVTISLLLCGSRVSCARRRLVLAKRCPWGCGGLIFAGAVDKDLQDHIKSYHDPRHEMCGDIISEALEAFKKCLKSVSSEDSMGGEGDSPRNSPLILENSSSNTGCRTKRRSTSSSSSNEGTPVTPNPNDQIYRRPMTIQYRSTNSNSFTDTETDAEYSTDAESNSTDAEPKSKTDADGRVDPLFLNPKSNSYSFSSFSDSEDSEVEEELRAETGERQGGPTPPPTLESNDGTPPATSSGVPVRRPLPARRPSLTFTGHLPERRPSRTEEQYRR